MNRFLEDGVGVSITQNTITQNKLVVTDATQTLSNKTLSTPTIQTPKISGTFMADTNGNELIGFPALVTNAVNEVTIENAITGDNPTVRATGNDANIYLELSGKGTRGVYVAGDLLMATAKSIKDTSDNELIKFPATVASAVNEITVSNSATGNAPSISATGNDTNINLNLIPKGTGQVTANGQIIIDESDFNKTLLTMVAGETLVVDDKIELFNNKLYKSSMLDTVLDPIGTTRTIGASTTDCRTAVIRTADRFVFCVMNQPRVYEYVYNASTMTWVKGTEVPLGYTYGSSYEASLSMGQLNSTNKFMIVQQIGTSVWEAYSFDFDGTTVSNLSVATNIYSGGSIAYTTFEIVSIASDKMIVVGRCGASTQSVRAVIVTLSGNTITAGTSVIVDTQNNVCAFVSATSLDSSRILLTYAIGTSRKAVIINFSGTTITVNTIVTISSDGNSCQLLTITAGSEYWQISDVGKLNKLSISGNTITVTTLITSLPIVTGIVFTEYDASTLTFTVYTQNDVWVHRCDSLPEVLFKNSTLKFKSFSRSLQLTTASGIQDRKKQIITTSDSRKWLIHYGHGVTSNIPCEYLHKLPSYNGIVTVGASAGGSATIKVLT